MGFLTCLAFACTGCLPNQGSSPENKFEGIVLKVENMLIESNCVESDSIFNHTFTNDNATISFNTSKVVEYDCFVSSLDDFFTGKEFSYTIKEINDKTSIVITEKKEESEKPIPTPPNENPIEADYTAAIENIYSVAGSLSSAIATDFVETKKEGYCTLTLNEQILEYGSYEEFKEMESEFQFPGFQVVITQSNNNIAFTITKC